MYYLWTKVLYSTEVDEAVEKAKEAKDPTGGRFMNGKMTSKHGGEGDAKGEILESAV